jgi:hypothetical protein
LSLLFLSVIRLNVGKTINKVSNEFWIFNLFRSIFVWLKSSAGIDAAAPIGNKRK